MYPSSKLPKQHFHFALVFFFICIDNLHEFNYDCVRILIQTLGPSTDRRDEDGSFRPAAREDASAAL